MTVNRTLKKKGYTYYEDSQYITYEKQLSNGRFEQIKVHIKDKTAQCSNYILYEDGYHPEPLAIDLETLKAIFGIVTSLVKKEEKYG